MSDSDLVVRTAALTTSNEPSTLRRLAWWCHDRRRAVLGMWLAALVGVGGIAFAAGDGFSTAFNVPGAESQRALDLLYDRFPEQSGFGAELVLRSDRSFGDEATAQAVADLVEEVRAIPEVAEVVTPYQPEAWARTCMARDHGCQLLLRPGTASHHDATTVM